MSVPVSDQKRLIHILADDLQPRIDWAYALEQTIALLGGGYLTAGNGDPNGLVTKPEGYLFLDLTTPAVWQNQNGGTVWTKLGAGGGSGLPPQWTVDNAHGDVIAAVDDPTKRPIEIVGLVDQSEALLTLTADTAAGTADVFLVRQSVAQGGGDIATIDDSGEFDLHVVDPGADGLKIDEANGPGDGVGRLLNLAGSMLNRNEIAEFLATKLGGVSGHDSQTLFDGGLRFHYSDNALLGDDYWAFDPVANATTLIAQLGQTAAVLIVKDASRNDVARVLPAGAIGTSAGEPADGDINPGECFRYFDPTNGAARTCLKGKTLDGTVVFGFGPMGP